MALLIPLGLRHAMEAGQAVLFVGAGAGFNAIGPGGARGPVGDELRDQLAAEYEIHPDGNDTLATITQLIEIQHGRKRLIASVARSLEDLVPDDDLQWLLSLRWRAIFTTNYDSLIEEANARDPRPEQHFVSFGANSEVRNYTPPFEIPIVHLHGSLASEAARESIIITEGDYTTTTAVRNMLFDRLSVEFPTSTVLYFGYGNQDPSWQSVFAEFRRAYAPASPPQAYRLTPTTTPNERLRLSALGVDTLDSDLQGFREACETLWGAERPTQVDAAAVSGTRVPAACRLVAEENPAAIARLLNAWEWVDAEAFDDEPNIAQFYRGEKPNWGVFAKGASFERDIEAALVNSLAEWATAPHPSVRSEIVLGPAGYGTSTLLRAVAAWYVQNGLGTTLWLKSGQRARTGDLEFAATRLPSPLTILVDDAASMPEDMDELVQYARDRKFGVFFLMAARTNEWRQARKRMRPTERELGPLSDDEITRLLDTLRSHKSLGKLEGLTPDLQHSAVRERNAKELFVTMREVTEGRAFDDIIAGEFERIGSEIGKDIYRLTCAFARIGAHLRDRLCEQVFDLATLDIPDHLRSDLSGVVSYETLDERKGIDGLVPRHRIIADIVWERCVVPAERERIMLSAIEQLNLTYHADRQAFGAFTRDDATVDGLGPLTAKTSFFERACRRDPTDAYIRQHYARMLRRNGLLDAALGQAEHALRLAPRRVAIQHTRGTILADMAFSSTTPELARRRLGQSELAFRQAIADNPRDEYFHKSLADLYTRWARRATDEDEVVAYVAKAKEVVEAGLSSSDITDGLLVAASNLARLVGDTEGRVEALERAVEENPANAYARALLADHYRQAGELQEASALLHQGLISDPGDPMLARLYGVCLYESGEPLATALSAVELARLRGAKDPRYLGTLGGLYALAGETKQADAVWALARNLHLPYRERNRLQFQPFAAGAPMAREGIVRQVGPGLTVLRTALGEVRYGGSSLHGVPLVEGTRIEFELGFSARGPVLVRIIRTL